MKKFVVSVSLLMLMVLVGCTKETIGEGNESVNEQESIRIVTTIAQISDPISEIGGDRVEVTSLMGPGIDPHLYQATQGDIRALQQADIIFYNGLHLEGNMGEIFANMSDSKMTFALGEVVNEDQLLLDEEGAIDPHIWFDISLWKEALNGAVEQLKEYSPKDADYFEQNKLAYFTKLDELQSYSVNKIGEIQESKRILVTAHDAFGYFGRMNDIEVVGLQGLSTEDEIGISDIQSTVDLLIERQIPAVFIESSISDQSIKSVIEGAAAAGLEVSLGGELFSDAMGEYGTEEGTYLGMYRHNVDTIYKALIGGNE
ncbi:zinc ABC transporter substrate-binding protein [Bacillus sp. B15-48]|uniref:metal ABC transporter solute-binding protein, Zn/Mn family n=1 Tax=Bacillus sp. B15-48 TaxID=1548601 RepID=UPI00193FF558|nr:zinc ABC transporter substrate-binding protein [Bacillus sp. B15-48]MBM4762881.1 manganese transporter [Bacillus sp. B15-48]